MIIIVNIIAWRMRAWSADFMTISKSRFEQRLIIIKAQTKNSYLIDSIRLTGTKFDI